MARPSIYSEELGLKICDLLASGMSLLQICKQKEMPDKATVFNWLGKKQAFLDNYIRAREAQMETMAHEIEEIADNEEGDFYSSDKGFVPNHAKIQRDKLRVDTKKWLMSKMKPKKYGERQTLVGEQDNPLTINLVTKMPDKDE